MVAVKELPDSLVLDGGLATQLERLGFDTSGPLWSARALLDAPHRVARAQQEFVLAGAECVSTATYQATIAGLVDQGASPASAERTMAESVDQARIALRAFPASGRATLVVASVGPYGAALADGSEYRGDYDLDADGLRRFHRRRLELLLEREPDLVAFETIPSATEVRVLVELQEELAGPDGVPAWLSLSVRNGDQLADGSPLAGTWLEEVATSRCMAALGVNCLAPPLVQPALETLRTITPVPLVAYPNSGGVWHHGAWHAGLCPQVESAVLWAQRAPQWWHSGARWLGGCCRTGLDHIAALATEVAALRRTDQQR